MVQNLSKIQPVIYSNQRGEWKMFTGEARIAKYLDLIGIKWQKEPKRFDLGRNVFYIPDFYIPSMNLYIEVKNRNYETIDEIDKLKMKMFYEKGFDLYVMRRPPDDINNITNDFRISKGMFYSNKFLHDDDNSTRLLIPKRSIHSNHFNLEEIGDYGGLSFIEEAIIANQFNFKRIGSDFD